jgi:hypothetical protein
MEPDLAALIASGLVEGPIADSFDNKFMLRLADGIRFFLLVHTNNLVCEACLCQVERKRVLAHVCNKWWEHST